MKKIICSAALSLSMLSLQAQGIRLSVTNVEEVLQEMTLEEKATLLVGHYFPMYSADGTYIGGQSGLIPGAAGETQAIPRLGIPATVLSDGPAGMRINPVRNGDQNTYYCTGFPVGICLASTWNTELVESVGKSIGNEALEYGADVLLAPGMNIIRHPLCGRNYEYYSEDPVVSGKIAAAYVRGIQSNGVGTSIKHFVANNQETNRFGNDARISQRALREIYLKGFEIAVKESDPWTVMSSYNRLNGPYTQANSELLNTVLRDEWGFNGIVMTDWTEQRNTAEQVAAGNDLMEPGTPEQTQEIINEVKSGKLKMTDVDACVRRILQYIVKTPRFRNYQYSNKPNMKAHAQVTRQSAAEGMVLLKNEDNTLPLKNVKKISLYGVNSYDFIAGGSGSGDVNKPYVIDLLTGLNKAGYRVSKDLKELYEKYRDYAYKDEQSELGFFASWGKPKIPEMPVRLNLCYRKANVDDIAIITIARNAGENADRVIRNDYTLTEVERNLLNDVCEAYHSAGKKVVVILNVGGIIETESWKNLPDAILIAWQPGQEGGYSVADILSGEVNPSGKLPVTFPNNITDAPTSSNFPLYDAPAFSWAPVQAKKDVDYTVYQEGIYLGYRYFKTKEKSVSYPFGYGLSYTTFAYSKPVMKNVKNGFDAAITVTNTGKVAGKEVVQLYVTAPQGAVEKPAMELKAFAKTRELQPGESQTLTMHVSNYDLGSYVTNLQSWVSDTGTYIVKFASHAEDVRATANYRLSKQEITRCHDVLKPQEPINELSIKK